MYYDMCRICMKTESYINIFQDKNHSDNIANEIMSVAKVDISQDDGLPMVICTECSKKLNCCMEFKKLCEETDTKLRSMLIVSEDEFTQETDSILNDFESKLDGNDILCPIVEIECNKKSKKDLKVKNKKKQQLQCFTCGKIMSSRFRLKTHLITHTGERPFSCLHCNKNFSLKQNLKVHLRIHTGEKPLRCSICGETFAQSAGLSAHRRKHTGQTPYQCVLCPRSFRTVGHLQYHIRRHTGEKNFECDTCGKAFITRSDLKQHIVTHTGDRPHVCSVCGARMTRASHLKRHMQHTHQGIHAKATFAQADADDVTNPALRPNKR